MLASDIARVSDLALIFNPIRGYFASSPSPPTFRFCGLDTPQRYISTAMQAL